MAAGQGDAGAQYILGEMYDPFFSGVPSGVSRDAKKAAKWYRLAADQRRHHRTVYDRDEVQQRLGGLAGLHSCAMWFNLAGASGQKHGAITNRDNIALKMTPDQIAEAQRTSTRMEAKSEPIT